MFCEVATKKNHRLHRELYPCMTVGSSADIPIVVNSAALVLRKYELNTWNEN